MWAEKGGLDFEGRARWDAWTNFKASGRPGSRPGARWSTEAGAPLRSTAARLAGGGHGEGQAGVCADLLRVPGQGALHRHPALAAARKQPTFQHKQPTFTEHFSPLRTAPPSWWPPGGLSIQHVLFHPPALWFLLPAFCKVCSAGLQAAGKIESVLPMMRPISNGLLGLALQRRASPAPRRAISTRTLPTMDEFVWPDDPEQLWAEDSELPLKVARLTDLSESSPKEINDLAESAWEMGAAVGGSRATAAAWLAGRA